MQDDVAASAASQVADSALLGDQPGITDLAEENTADPNGESTATARDQHARDAEAIARMLLAGLREVIASSVDFREPPLMRVAGRVVYVLTVSRGWPSCTGVEVFRVFLEEIPQQLPEYLRQDAGHVDPAGASVSARTGLRTIYKRLTRLVGEGFATTTATTSDAKDREYVTTDLGRLVFDGWPTYVHLSETPVTRTRSRRPSLNRVTRVRPAPQGSAAPPRAFPDP